MAQTDAKKKGCIVTERKQNVIMKYTRCTLEQKHGFKKLTCFYAFLAPTTLCQKVNLVCAMFIFELQVD